MGDINIVADLLDAGQLLESITNAAKQIIPPQPDKLNDEFRWMRQVIKNSTQFPLVLQSSCFDSGEYWTAGAANPVDLVYTVQPWSMNTLCLSNKDGSVTTGVTGGNAFKLMLDDKGKTFEVAFGWRNPALGSFKAGVKETGSAKEGYEASNDKEKGNTIVSSQTYKARDKRIKFEVTSASGAQCEFHITQQMA